MSEANRKRPGEALEIERLWAVIGTDPSGEEGIVGLKTLTGWTPLVFSTRTTLDAVIPSVPVEAITAASGETISIVEFSRVGVVRVLSGPPIDTSGR